MKLFVIDSIYSKQTLLSSCKELYADEFFPISHIHLVNWTLSRLASKQIISQSILVACILFNIYHNAPMRYHLFGNNSNLWVSQYFKILKMPFKCWGLSKNHSLLSDAALGWICWCSLMNFTKSLFACASLPSSWCEIVYVPIKIHISPFDCWAFQSKTINIKDSARSSQCLFVRKSFLFWN